MIIGIDGNEANVVSRVGSGQYGFELLKAFHSDESGHQFEIFLKNPPVSDMPAVSPDWHYKVFGPKKFWTQVALPLKLARNNHLDVFFSPSHYAPRFSRVPQVITIFDLSFLYFPQYFRKKDLGQLKRWTKYSALKSKAIITISENSKRDIVKEYKVDPKQVFVTYPGYDKTRFKVQKESDIQKIKDKYSIPGDYIIFVGTLQPRKNIEKLIEAFVGIGSTYPDLKLVIVGKKGWMFESIFETVKRNKLGDKVIFTDFVPDDDTSFLIAGARLYVLPSLYEGFGIPVVEAMASGTPVAVSDVSSLPEVVGDAGLLFDPQDIGDIQKKCEKILKDGQLSTQLSKKGIERAKKFNWAHTAAETIKVLESVGQSF